MEVYVIVIPFKNIHRSWSYKHSKLKLGVRVMRDGLRVGLVQTTVSYTRSNINVFYLIAIDRRDVEAYTNAIIIIR